MVKYCRELTEIYLDFSSITTDSFNRFIGKFGKTIRKCDYDSNYYIEVKQNPIILDNCFFIEQLNLLSLYSNYDLLNSHYFKLERFPRLKCLVFWLWYYETQVISKLIDYNSKTFLICAQRLDVCRKTVCHSVLRPLNRLTTDELKPLGDSHRIPHHFARPNVSVLLEQRPKHLFVGKTFQITHENTVGLLRVEWVYLLAIEKPLNSSIDTIYLDTFIKLLYY